MLLSKVAVPFSVVSSSWTSIANRERILRERHIGVEAVKKPAESSPVSSITCSSNEMLTRESFHQSVFGFPRRSEFMTPNSLLSFSFDVYYCGGLGSPVEGILLRWRGFLSFAGE